MTESNDMLRSALLMVLAAFFFAAMTALIRLGSDELHPFQIAFFRNLFGLMFMLPWLFRGGLSVLRTKRIGLYWLRALLGIATMLTWFWSLTKLPLAQAVSLSFTTPLFVTVGAALLLGEQVRGRRWAATLIGFLGAMIILRPGVQTVSLPMLATLASAAAMAASILLIKRLVQTESPNAVVIYMVLMMTPMSLLAALPVWQWPSAVVWAWMVLLGGAGTAGHLLFTRAIDKVDASAIMPFDFARLPFAAALGWMLFDQVLDGWTVIGGLVIFTSGVYIARREAKVAAVGRRRTTRAKGGTEHS